MSVKVKNITMSKSSGFCYSLTASIVSTPKGKIRTIEIVDNEVEMAVEEYNKRWNEIWDKIFKNEK
jgi:hypothetical protein